MDRQHKPINRKSLSRLAADDEHDVEHGVDPTTDYITAYNEYVAAYNEYVAAYLYDDDYDDYFDNFDD